MSRDGTILAPAAGSSVVTIDRAYFDTLVRRHVAISYQPSSLFSRFELTLFFDPLSRANYNCEDGRVVDQTFPVQDPSVINVLKDKYQSLALEARKYANLRRNLMNGGVDDSTIALLSQDDASASETTTPQPAAYSYQQTSSANVLQPAPTHPRPSRDAKSGRPLHHNSQIDFAHNGHLTNVAPIEPVKKTFFPTCSVGTPTSVVSNQRAPLGPPKGHRFLTARICKRTVVLSNLPDNATYLHVTNAVRGGLLLDVFLKQVECVGIVSFLREEDAVRFQDHARTNGVYVKNNKLSVKWADRHFQLHDHVANKVASGASRNLVVRYCDPSHTEDSVREDLEHIHNLVVIKIDFLDGHCYIKTNSIRNAMFAKTCMISRAKYKGSKIEWDEDECQQPIEVTPRVSVKAQSAPSVKPPVSMLNRFASLRMDDDDDDVDNKLDTASEMPNTVGIAS